MFYKDTANHEVVNNKLLLLELGSCEPPVKILSTHQYLMLVLHVSVQTQFILCMLIYIIDSLTLNGQ
jgi:hypothetical protein